MKKIIITVLSAGLLVSGFYLYTKNQEAKIDEFINVTDIAGNTELSTNINATVTGKIDQQKVGQKIVKQEKQQEPQVEVKTKTFTKEEIAKHNKKSDCFMYINGSVLDVTNFVSLHPGGDKILKGCGQDATNYFNRVPSHMQGQAQKLLTKLKIGDLAQ